VIRQSCSTRLPRTPTYLQQPLTGELAGYWSITVRANWRIIFRFEEGDAAEVGLVDYH
jgi:toxin HigB-1